VGYIELASKDPLVYPKIQPNYYQDPADLQTMMEGVKLCRKIARAKVCEYYLCVWVQDAKRVIIVQYQTWQGLIGEEIVNKNSPYDPESDEYIIDLIQKTSLVILNPRRVCVWMTLMHLFYYIGSTWKTDCLSSGGDGKNGTQRGSHGRSGHKAESARSKTLEGGGCLCDAQGSQRKHECCQHHDRWKGCTPYQEPPLPQNCEAVTIPAVAINPSFFFVAQKSFEERRACGWRRRKSPRSGEYKDLGVIAVRNNPNVGRRFLIPRHGV